MRRRIARQQSEDGTPEFDHRMDSDTARRVNAEKEEDPAAEEAALIVRRASGLRPNACQRRDDYTIPLLGSVQNRHSDVPTAHGVYPRGSRGGRGGTYGQEDH